MSRSSARPWPHESTTADDSGLAASDAVTYSFRNRMVLSHPLTGPPDDPGRCVLASDSDSELVEIFGPRGDEPILHAMELRLRASGYVTREDAIEAGKFWRDRLTVAFAHFEMGIEVGSDETPDAAEWSGGQPYFIYQLGRRMRDTPKLAVFRQIVNRHGEAATPRALPLNK
jgi:hypothetical protein